MIEHWTPPEGDKDLAAMHARERREAHEAAQQRRAAAAAQVEDPDEPDGAGLPGPT